LVWNNGTWTIEKLAPANTVSVNQRDVQQAAINSRDTIGLGATISFVFLASPAVPQTPNAPMMASSGNAAAPVQAPPPPPPFIPAQTDVEQRTVRAPMPDMVGGVAGTPDKASLEVSSNISREKHSYALNKQVINIGREPSSDIVINETVVSGFHAQIVRDGNQLILVHPHPSRQGTLNGLLYQGRHIPGNQVFRKPLARGDIFRIRDEHGTLVTLTFNDGSGAPQDILPEIRPIPLGAPLLTIGRAPDNTMVLKFLGSFFAAGWAMAGMGTSMGLHSDKLGADDCSYAQPLPDQPPHFYQAGANPGNCAYRGDLFVSVNTHAAHAAAVNHLLLVWGALAVMCLALGLLTAYFLKRKDVRG